MRLIVLPLLASVVGCGSPSPLQEADQRYRHLMMNEGSPEELCDTARAGKRIATEANDRAAFGIWALRSTQWCERRA